MHNPNILRQMVKIYGFSGTDWMGYKVTKKNSLTYHHINEKRNLDKEEKEIETIENGALLSKKAHRILHTIELYDNDLYEEYRYLFRMINEQKCPINETLTSYVYELKKRTECSLMIITDVKMSKNSGSSSKKLA